MAPTLVIREPGRTPLRLSLGLEPVEVGRDCSGLLLTDPLVSRRHLELRRIGTAVQIVELGSTNGTLVDGMPLTGSHWLRDGEIVGLGSTTIVLSSNDRDDTPVPAAFTVVELNPPRVLTNPTGRRRGVALVSLVVLAVAALAFPRGRPESSVAEPDNSSQTDDLAVALAMATPAPEATALERRTPTPYLAMSETDFGPGFLEPEEAQSDAPVAVAAATLAARVRADAACSPVADALAPSPNDVRFYRYFRHANGQRAYSVTMFRFARDSSVDTVLETFADPDTTRECAERFGVPHRRRIPPTGLTVPWVWTETTGSVAVLLKVGPVLLRVEQNVADGTGLVSDAELVRVTSLFAARLMAQTA